MHPSTHCVCRYRDQDLIKVIITTTIIIIITTTITIRRVCSPGSACQATSGVGSRECGLSCEEFVVGASSAMVWTNWTNTMVVSWG
jgi:hypothetical protein